MKLAFVSVENGLATIGFRKVAAVARLLHPSTEVLYVVPTSFYSPLNIIMPKRVDKEFFSEEEVGDISQHLASFDMVCFSSMTSFADLTKKIITKIRNINPNTYIVWGGIHPIIDPNDAIPFADAICVGEGEKAFNEFFTSYAAGSDFTTTGNFWFNQNGSIIKNRFFPLSTPEEMDTFPFPLYAEGELMYRKDKRAFTKCVLADYLDSNNLAYIAVWSIGCPNKCTYCGNSKFIENDKNYRRLRHPSVEYIITEVERVLEKHPHISTVSFMDDSFMVIPYATIERFATLWKERIGIPFAILGLIPSAVNKEKIAVLVQAGMNRLRMGIQSGSDRILEFYKRPNPPGVISKATAVIAEFKGQIIAPVYDIMLDNPIETPEDVGATLEMIYELPRPFSLSMASLRVMPNTELERELKRLNVNIKQIGKNMITVEHTFANLVVYLLTLFKPPKWIFTILLKQAKLSHEAQSRFPVAHVVFRTLHLVKRALSHLRFLDFSVMQGKAGYALWKLGLIRNKRRCKKQIVNS